MRDNTAIKHIARCTKEGLKKFARKVWSTKKGRIGTYVLGAVVLCWIAMYIWVPRTLFPDPYSTLIYSRSGELMGARIAADGQWRFPMPDTLPQKFVTCLTTYEDKRFFWHPGVDILATARAARQNLSSGKIVSGGSTITMQLARIARKGKERTFGEKAIEMAWAVFLETKYSKKKILNLYASHAPFGGNVVGLETAAWRYFGRPAADLSWAEMATLTVLPNSPALIHPGRNRQKLLEKRNGLLTKLRDKGVLNNMEYGLACMEPLPAAPVPLPNNAPHLLATLAKERQGERIATSINASLQRQTQEIVDHYAQEYASNHVYNLSALIADTETGEVLAYAGNVSFPLDVSLGGQVDLIQAPRSTGSVLKPFLYAAMLYDGLILPSTLIADTPLNINGYSPQNFTKSYSGAVPANVAIERSLNVPLVRMLSSYNTGRFLTLLKSLGMTTLSYSEEHYGSSLILGGAEGTMWDMAGMYASLARTLKHYSQYNGRYNPQDIHPLTPFVTQKEERPITSMTDDRLTDKPLLSAASIWFTFEAMSAVNRPEEESEWQQFESMKRVAWKTGTSFGGRDAWAIGVTPRYVVAVWAGNASGEGRAGLTGVGYAAPVLFDLFSLLPSSSWFDVPYDEMEKVAICRKSGYKASPLCEADMVYVPLSGRKTPVCPFHKLVHLTLDGRYQVNSSCEPLNNIKTCSWFVLPPAQEYYYRSNHVDYRTLPPFKPGCEPASERQIDIIYPEHGSVLFLPKGLSGQQEKFVFKAADGRPDAKVYWHVDNLYLGMTVTNHQMACAVKPGKHILALVDDQGNQRKIMFEVQKAPTDKVNAR
jgi:penicillin-binding protein 1C